MPCSRAEGGDLASTTIPAEGPALPVSTFDYRLMSIPPSPQGTCQPACACGATRIPCDVLKGTQALMLQFAAVGVPPHGPYVKPYVSMT